MTDTLSASRFAWALHSADAMAASIWNESHSGFMSILVITVDVLKDVSAGAPVFLTKNGRGKYAILDMQEYEQMEAKLMLMNGLSKGKKAGEEKVWIFAEAVRDHFSGKRNEE